MTEDQLYNVGNGFNVQVGDKRPTKYAPAELLRTNEGYELRYEVGTAVLRSQLHPKALEVLDWLEGKGCLVAVEPEPAEPEEDANG